MQINRKLGFITPVIRGIPVWEHSEASDPLGRISHQLFSCGFHQLIMQGAEMMTMVSCFSEQGYSWFGCIYKLVALVRGRDELTIGTYLCQTERAYRTPSDPISAVTVMCRTISRWDPSQSQLYVNTRVKSDCSFFKLSLLCKHTIFSKLGIDHMLKILENSFISLLKHHCFAFVNYFSLFI